MAGKNGDMVEDMMNFIREREREKVDLHRSVDLMVKMFKEEGIGVKYVGDKSPPKYDKADAVFKMECREAIYRGTSITYHISFTDVGEGWWDMYAEIDPADRQLSNSCGLNDRFVALPAVRQEITAPEQLSSLYYRLLDGVKERLRSVYEADEEPHEFRLSESAEILYLDTFDEEIVFDYFDKEVPRTSWIDVDIQQDK